MNNQNNKIGILENMNERVKKLSVMDLKLIQGTTMLGTLIAAKMMPQIMGINIWWFVVLLVICAIKPLYVFWIKK